MAASNSYKWDYRSPEFISNRYNELAAYYRFFELIFFVHAGLRKRAINELGLKAGDTVLEIGCGTGRNLRLLSNKTGKNGTVYGVDVSPAMLQRAEQLKKRSHLDNVKLVLADGKNGLPDVPINGFIFSLSYAVMGERKEILRQAWNRLRPGGKAVIFDGQFPKGITGRLFSPFKPIMTLFLKATVLGNPFIDSAQELKEVTGVSVDIKEYSMRSYFIACAVKN